MRIIGGGDIKKCGGLIMSVTWIGVIQDPGDW